MQFLFQAHLLYRRVEDEDVCGWVSFSGKTMWKWIIYFVVWLFRFVFSTWERIWWWMKSQLKEGRWSEIDDVRLLLSRAEPVSVAFVVDPEYCSASWRPKLMRVVEWCAEADVGMLWMYDCAGKLAEDAEDLVEAVKGFETERGREIRVEVASRGVGDGVLQSSLEEERNRVSSPGKQEIMLVRLLSPLNGRSAIDAYAKWISMRKDYRKMSSQGRKEEISRVMCEDPLSLMAGREPKLLIGLGPVPSIAGFPSWELRLTQFFLREDLGTLEQSTLDKILAQHLDTPIRFGR